MAMFGRSIDRHTLGLQGYLHAKATKLHRYT
jgi:hypothetical protein